MIEKPKTTITLNGQLYDAHTGARLDSSTGKQAPKTRQYGSFDIKPAGQVHRGPSRSETLRRSVVSKPATRPTPLAARHIRTITPVATHAAVSHFGRPADGRPAEIHTVTPSDVLARTLSDTPVQLAAQVQNYTPSASIALPKAHKPISTREKVIAHQLTLAKTRAQKKPHHSWLKQLKRLPKHIRFTPPVAITGLIVIAIAGCALAYFTVPALSLFVGAKSAGISATYPNYVPAGYHFKGPVSYHSGEVSIAFKASGASDSFTVAQSTTFWDSEAVLDNYVLARTSNYLTYSENGLTIYTFGSQAAWVNAGILHTISGTAQLTSDQILRIAASM